MRIKRIEYMRVRKRRKGRQRLLRRAANGVRGRWEEWNDSGAK